MALERVADHAGVMPAARAAKDRAPALVDVADRLLCELDHAGIGPAEARVAILDAVGGADSVDALEAKYELSDLRRRWWWW